MWGGVSGLCIALGPLIGGAVVEGLSWQAIFWLNIPSGVLCLPPILAALPESYGRPQRLDLLGLAIAGVFLVVFGIVRGEEAGWSSGEVLASLIGGGALLIAFIAWEARAPEPMMPLRLFRNRSFAVANIAGVLFSLGIFGAVFIRIQFLQVAQGASALKAGGRTMPWTMAPLVVAPLTGGLITPKIGLRPAIVAGLACMTASLVWIALVLEADVDYLRLVSPFALAGIGMGLVSAPIASAVLEGIASEDQAVASGTNSTAREIGVALGIAALSAVFTTAGGELNPDGFIDGAVPAIAAGAIALAAATLAGLLLPGFKPVRISPLTGEPVVRHRAESPPGPSTCLVEDSGSAAQSRPGPKLTPMSAFLSIPVLRGALASLVPLGDEHAEDLADAAGQHGMQSLWYTRIPAADPADVAEEIALRHRQHADGSMVPWAVLDADGRAVGMTTFMHIEPEHRRLEIGSTWLAPSVQGTGVNPQIKLLMLARAFEDLDCIAVEFRTHWHNRQSRAAIAALGAKQDGVLRSHQLMDDGSLRDTVVFSITAAEWPIVRRGLLERLRSRHGIEPADALGGP